MKRDPEPSNSTWAPSSLVCSNVRLDPGLATGVGWTWHLFSVSTNFTPWMIGGILGGFITALVTIFKKDWAAIKAPIYALLEGLFLGRISAIFESRYPGIVIQAVGLTFGTLACLLMTYRVGLIKPTGNFKLGVMAATGGIALLYFVSIALDLFNIQIPLIHSSGMIGIDFSLVVVVIVALNLVLDFDFIENRARMGAPKYTEWYAAFGLIVTLVWPHVHETSFRIVTGLLVEVSANAAGH